MDWSGLDRKLLKDIICGIHDKYLSRSSSLSSSSSNSSTSTTEEEYISNMDIDYMLQSHSSSTSSINKLIKLQTLD